MKKLLKSKFVQSTFIISLILFGFALDKNETYGSDVDWIPTIEKEKKVKPVKWGGIDSRNPKTLIWDTEITEENFNIIFNTKKLDYENKLEMKINDLNNIYKLKIDIKDKDFYKPYYSNQLLKNIGIDNVNLAKEINTSSFTLRVKAKKGFKLSSPIISKENDKFIISFKKPKKSIKRKAKFDSSKKDNKDLIINSRGFVELDGPSVSLILKDAEPKEALISLAKIGGYGFIYVPEKTTERNSTSKNNLVTLSFQNETYERAFNSILLSSNLQAKKEKNIILVGPSILGRSFDPQVSKIYNLDQTSASSAADYLASLGALISKVNSTSVGTNSESSLEKASEKKIEIESYGAFQGPLKGLMATSDSRTETITLIGDIKLVELAEKHLDKIDSRQKQVALSVKIMDINIDKNDEFGNSFAWALNDAYILNDGGVLNAVFGPSDKLAISGSGGDSSNNRVVDGEFLNWLRAKIESNSTKVLASPTLILSESKDKIEGGSNESSGIESFANSSIGRPFANESFVTVGTKVITNYDVTSEEGSTPTCEAEFGTSGLTFGAKVHKIDNNGFITFSISPELSATTGTINTGTCGTVSILSIRRLDTGTVRVKSGQTLILTGVISDTDSEVISKWPILGDIPGLGNIFKSKSKGTNKSELVITVTPKIIDEDQPIMFKNTYLKE